MWYLVWLLEIVELVGTPPDRCHGERRTLAGAGKWTWGPLWKDSFTLWWVLLSIAGVSRTVQDPSLTHVRLLVDEYTACFRFYRDILGFEPTFGDADSGYADFDTGDVTLALFEAAELEAALDESSSATPGRDGVCVVLRVTDVDQAATTLRDQGVELAAEPTDHPEWGIRTVHVRDPDGTLLELNHPLDA